MKFSIKDFFSKCEQIRSFLQISSHLLKKSLMKNFIFCAVSTHFMQLVSFYTLREKCPYSAFSGAYFPLFGLNTERYSVCLPIQSEFGKMWIRKTPNTDFFHAVILPRIKTVKQYPFTLTESLYC